MRVSGPTARRARKTEGTAGPRGKPGCSDADGVHAAVDMHDLAGGRGEPVGEQRDAGLRGRAVVGDVPAERRAFLPERLEQNFSRSDLVALVRKELRLHRRNGAKDAAVSN